MESSERIQFGRDRYLPLEEMSPGFLASWLLLTFTDDDTYLIDTPLQQLVVATFGRSKATFQAITSLLLDELPTQAAMLTRSLFEDLVVAHWLVLNADDSDWLITRFQDHRDAMALHQLDLQTRTGFQLGEPIVENPEQLRYRQSELGKKFKGGARRDWWDPGTQGHGNGTPIGLSGVAGFLEDAAAEHRMVHPRFAGGERVLLRDIELVAHKYFSQMLHHTAVGLPFEIVSSGGVPGPTGNPTAPVEFLSWWMFCQQVYLLHDLYGRKTEELDERVRFGFENAYGAKEGDLKPFPGDGK